MDMGCGLERMRIDISKKLGLENKEVLAVAKELGIVAARVASSFLDGRTGRRLERELIARTQNNTFR
jgi:hypothetical protein